jgi:hypothetical protein
MVATVRLPAIVHLNGIVTHPGPTWQPHALDAKRFGGADRDRTGGLLVANEALSQLSYSPTVPATTTLILSGVPDEGKGRARPHPACAGTWGRIAAGPFTPGLEERVSFGSVHVLSQFSRPAAWQEKIWAYLQRGLDPRLRARRIRSGRLAETIPVPRCSRPEEARRVGLRPRLTDRGEPVPRGRYPRGSAVRRQHSRRSWPVRGARHTPPIRPFCLCPTQAAVGRGRRSPDHGPRSADPVRRADRGRAGYQRSPRRHRHPPGACHCRETVPPRQSRPEVFPRPAWRRWRRFPGRSRRPVGDYAPCPFPAPRKRSKGTKPA